MTTDVFIPTLWRAQNLEPVLASLEENTSDYLPLVICQAGDEPTISEARRLGVRFVVADQGNPATAVQKVNLGYRHSWAPFFFIGSDDIRFTPGWLDEAFKLMVDPISVVGINDDVPAHRHGGELPGHVLVRRSYIDEESGVADLPGTVLYEGYRHYYSDLEFWQTAMWRGRFASAFDSHIVHHHPNSGTAETDETYKWSRSFMSADRQLYMQRRHVWEGIPA